MPGQHKEIAFDAAIEHHLITSGGNTKDDHEAFDQGRCINAKVFLAFVQETQPKE